MAANTHAKNKQNGGPKATEPHALCQTAARGVLEARARCIVVAGLKPRSLLKSSLIGHFRICRALKSCVSYHVIKHFKRIGWQ